MLIFSSFFERSYIMSLLKGENMQENRLTGTCIYILQKKKRYLQDLLFFIRKKALVF